MYHTHWGQTPLRRFDSTGRSGRVHQEPVCHKRSQPASRLLGGGAEVRQPSSDIKKRKRLDAPQQSGVATPSPRLRRAHETRSNRIERDVPMDFRGVARAFDEHCAVARVKDVSALGSVPVGPLAVPTVEVLHPRCDVGLGCFDEEVIVRREHAIGSAGPVLAVYRGSEKQEKSLPVAVVATGQSADVRASRHVVETAGDLDTVGARHDGDDRRETGEAYRARQFFDKGVRGQTRGLERCVPHAAQDETRDEKRDDEPVQDERRVVPAAHVPE